MIEEHSMSKPWDNIISEDEQNAYNAAGFGRPTGMGQRPALLIIDVQYRTVGTVARPFWESIKEFPTSCGDVGWRAVKQIERLLTVFRTSGWPCCIPMSRRRKPSIAAGYPTRSRRS
jgi:maleamate amidohydrolase